ncbi:hypothetical protein BC940DRAFT_365869 [Gongronella butleri]|nr:hypothetical protein BC940DRAFT_365869 [Gongronella butleri]
MDIVIDDRERSEIVQLTAFDAYNQARKAMEQECNEVDEQGRDPSQSTTVVNTSVQRRPSRKLLNDLHGTYLKEIFDDESTTSLDEAVGKLKQQFKSLEIKPHAVRKFIRDKLDLTFKRVARHPEARNSDDKLEKRFAWVTHWQATSMDYMTNCVFALGLDIETTRRLPPAENT